MASRKPNGTYISRVRLRDGRRLSRVFPTETQALTWEAESKRRIRAGDDPIMEQAEHGRLVGEFFAEAVEYLYDTPSSLKNVRSVARRLANIIGPETRLAAVDERTATIIGLSLQKQGLSGGTNNAYAAVFNRIMEHGRKLGVVNGKPRMEYKKLKNGRTRFLSDLEEASLLAYYKHVGLDSDHDLIMFLLYTGARWSEAQNLRREDCEIDRVTFWETKDGLERTVPLADKARAALGMALARTNCEYPFSIRYSTFRDRFERALQHIGGMDGVTIHTLRHTTASRLVRNGVDIRRVKDFLGHKNIQTTMRYAHLAPADLFDAAKALD